MKIILLANHDAIVPLIEHFNEKGWLQTVVSTVRLGGQHLVIEEICAQKEIHFLKIDESEVQTKLKDLFIDKNPDLAMMLGFSYLIPKSIFSIPRLGFYNVHFSLLPAYRGADPVFWQLFNGEEIGGISIHKVDENYDKGEVVMRQEIPFISGETNGICNSRYQNPCFNMISNLAERLHQQNRLVPIEQLKGTGSYYGRPSVNDFMIKWEIQTAQQIENLVNATNPNAGGAITTFRKQPIRMLEVSPVEGFGEEGISAGEIIHADGTGIYVQCVDRKILRVNILNLNEGIITGAKLVALGAQKGDRFENKELYAQQIIKN